MFKKYICLLIVFIFALGSLNCFAYDVQSDYAKDIIKISGKTEEPKEFVTLLILNKGEDHNSFQLSDTPGNLILYNGQTISDSKGEFSFEFPYSGEQGRYNAYVTTEYGEIVNEVIPFVSSFDYNKAVSDLNTYAGAGDSDNFAKTIAANDVLFESELNSVVNINAASDMFFDYTKKNPIDKDSKDKEVTDLYETFLVMQAVNEGDDVSFEKWTEALTIKADIKDFVKEIIAESSTKTYFNGIIKGKQVLELEKFENLLKEASILAKVRYSGGYLNTKKVLQKYSDFIGIKSTANDKVYQSIAGQEYKSIAELKNAFDNFSNSSQSGSGTGSGGGGGGGGGGGSSSPIKKNTLSNTEFSVEKSAVEAEKNEKINVKFNDIDGFRWANTAILSLADKGIISGRGDERFCPEDFITREEFIKIIIEAMGISHQKQNACKFADVDVNEWYAEYVQAAYDKKIVNGISEDSFGVGANITRQDIAVIMYNAANLGKNGSLYEGIDFTDKNDFADYAVNAINAISSLGVIKGYETGEFKPNDFANRAEAAQIVYGMLGFLNK